VDDVFAVEFIILSSG